MTVDLAPVERNTVSEEIIKQLVALINAGKLKPGAKLPSERELMEKFQVSRSSVREALHALTMIGLLETYPGAGTFVSKQLVNTIQGQLEWTLLLASNELVELMEVREPLEVQAAGLAAERATPESIEEFRRVIQQYIDSRGSGKRMMEAEVDVHLTIARMSGNHTLFGLLQTFHELLNGYRAKNLLGFSTDTNTDQEYMDLLAAIEQGNEELARQAMALHIRHGKRRALVAQMNDHLEHPEAPADEGQQS